MKYFIPNKYEHSRDTWDVIPVYLPLCTYKGKNGKCGLIKNCPDCIQMFHIKIKYLLFLELHKLILD